MKSGKKRNDEEKGGKEIEFGLHLGPLCDPINDQLKLQGLHIPDEKDLSRIEHLCKAVVMVNIHGLFSDSACKKARQRIMTKIKGYCQLYSGESDAANK